MSKALILKEFAISTSRSYPALIIPRKNTGACARAQTHTHTPLSASCCRPTGFLWVRLCCDHFNIHHYLLIFSFSLLPLSYLPCLSFSPPSVVTNPWPLFSHLRFSFWSSGVLSSLFFLLLCILCSSLHPSSPAPIQLLME